MSMIMLIGLLYCGVFASAQQVDSVHKTNWIKGLTQHQSSQAAFHFRIASSIAHNKIVYTKPSAFYLSKKDLQLLDLYETVGYFNTPFGVSNECFNSLFKEKFNDYVHYYLNPYVISPLEKTEFRNIPQQ